MKSLIKGIRQDYLVSSNNGAPNTQNSLKFEKYLSDGELRDRLDLYSRGSAKQFFKIQKIKQQYLERIRADKDKRITADLHYAQGVRSGLPHIDHGNIQDSREEMDQNYRDSIIKQSKGIYRSNVNLSKLVNRHACRGTLMHRFSSTQRKMKLIPDQKPETHKQKGLRNYFFAKSTVPKEIHKTFDKARGRTITRER